MIVLNDLYDYDLKIYQETNSFNFSLDSILLGEFVSVKKNTTTILDLCSGNAPVPLILAHKYPKINITALELQKSIYELATKSIAYNHLENQITMLNMNALDSPNYFPGNNFDIITCNPPFFKVGDQAKINATIPKALARHELAITLEDIFSLSKKLLKPQGELYLVHRPERLEEILNLATKYNLACKKIELITPEDKDYAIIVLLKFVQNARLGGLKIRTHTLLKNQKTYQNMFKEEK